MSLSQGENVLANGQRVRTIATSADLPTTSLGTWNPGDLFLVEPPIAGGPWAYTITAIATPLPGAITYAPVGVVNQGSSRSVAGAAAVTTADSGGIVIVTAAGGVSIPTASTMPAFGPVTLINATGAAVVVTPATGTIAGAGTLSMAANSGYTLLPGTGTAWYTVVGAS